MCLVILLKYFSWKKWTIIVKICHIKSKNFFWLSSETKKSSIYNDKNILKFDNSRIAKKIYGNFSQCTLAELFQSPLDANGHVQWGTSRTKSFALHTRGSLWICSAVRLLNGHVNWAKNRNLQKKRAFVKSKYHSRYKKVTKLGNNI